MQTAHSDSRARPAPVEQQVPGAVLLVDGEFLFRPPLLAHGDLHVPRR